MDTAIVNKIRNRDQQGLKDLFESYGDVIYGTILRMTKDGAVAQELLQSSFLKVWNNIEQYDSNKSGLFTWINTIARNTTLDKIRLKGYIQQQKTKTLEPTVYEVNRTYINNLSIDVGTLLSKLEEKNKILLDKVYLQGYSHKDVAEELNIPLGTVKSRLRIGLKTLREELKNEKNLFFGILLFIILLIGLVQWL